MRALPATHSVFLFVLVDADSTSVASQTSASSRVFSSFSVWAGIAARVALSCASPSWILARGREIAVSRNQRDGVPLVPPGRAQASFSQIWSPHARRQSCPAQHATWQQRRGNESARVRATEGRRSQGTGDAPGVARRHRGEGATPHFCFPVSPFVLSLPPFTLSLRSTFSSTARTPATRGVTHCAAHTGHGRALCCRVDSQHFQQHTAAACVRCGTGPRPSAPGLAM